MRRTNHKNPYIWDVTIGYRFGIIKSSPNTEQNSQKTVSSREFYSYHFMVKENHDHLFHFKSLLSQFATDMYAKIESERLSYTRHNQSLLLADSYSHANWEIIADDGAYNKAVLQVKTYRITVMYNIDCKLFITNNVVVFHFAQAYWVFSNDRLIKRMVLRVKRGGPGLLIYKKTQF